MGLFYDTQKAGCQARKKNKKCQKKLNKSQEMSRNM
jgi:hypothetical protein